MTKIEKVLRDLSNLRRFYIRLQQARKAKPGGKVEPASSQPMREMRGFLRGLDTPFIRDDDGRG